MKHAFAVSIVVSYAVVVLCGFVAVYLQHSLEADHLPFLALWFAPASLSVAAVSAMLSRPTAWWPGGVRYGIGLTVGGALGFGWTVFVQALSWGGVPFAVLVSWMAGGASGFISGLVLGRGSSVRVVWVTSAGLLVFGAAVVLVSRPIVAYFAHDQTLTVRFVKWTAGSEPLVIEEVYDDCCLRDQPLGDDAIGLLRSIKPTGRAVVMWGGGVDGRGPKATAVILLEKPIDRRVAFRQPDRTVALYVQAEDGFILHPPEAKTLGRLITMSPLPDGFWCQVDVAYGGSSGSPVRMP